MYRSGLGMKNKLLNILRSSCNGLKHNPPNAVTDVGLARFSSLATERSLLGDFSKRVAQHNGGNSSLLRDEWGRKHAVVHLSPSQLSASAEQHISRSCFARSFASQTGSKSKKSETRKEVSTVEDPFDSPTYNIPEKPVTFTEGASYTLVILAGLGIAGAAAYAICKELIFEPKEYKIFNKTLERVQNDGQVKVRIGSPITGYGSESRNRAARQRVAHRTWTDDDGNEHILVNFHIRGPHGAGRVYSEMFKDKVDKEWKYTYLIVEVTSPSPAQLMLESYIPA